MTRLGLALLLTLLLAGEPLAQGIPGTVTVQQPSAAKLHVTATQGGVWTLAHISSVSHVTVTGATAVYQSGGWTVTAAHQGGAWTIAHLSSVMHVAAAGVFAVQQGAAGAEVWPVRAHQGGAWAVSAAQSGVWTVQAAHQGGVWTIAHVSSVVHVAAAGAFQVQQGAAGAEIWPVRAHAGTGSLTVNQGGLWPVSAHKAGSWVVDHVSSVLHVAAAGPLPVVQSPQGGVWPVTAHQGGVWRIDHVTSVLHVAAAGPLPIVQSPQGGVWAVNAHQGGTSWTVSQGPAGNVLWPVAAHQAGAWNVAHVTSVVHVAAAGPLPIVVSPQAGVIAVTSHVGTGSRFVNQSGAWTIQAAHQAGRWNIDHVTSVTHVAGTVTANPATAMGKTITYVSVAQGAAGTTELAAASVGNKHKLLGAMLTLSATGTMKFTDGVADLTGAMDVSATGGFVLTTSVIPYQQTGAANRALNLVTTVGLAKGVVILLTEP